MQLAKSSPEFAFPFASSSVALNKTTTPTPTSKSPTAQSKSNSNSNTADLGHSFSKSTTRPTTTQSQSDLLTKKNSKNSSKNKQTNASSFTSNSLDRAQTAPLIKRTYKPTQAQSVYLQTAKAKSAENWIPENIRQGMVRRDIAVAKQNIETTLVREEASASEMNRHKLNALEKSQSRVKFGIDRKAKCGLCCMTFLPINLVLAVPLKAVLDMRSSWGKKFDPKFDVSMSRVNKNVQKGPMVYSSTSVCAFCAQLFAKQQDVYRPSWESKEKELKQVEDDKNRVQRNEYWDPLKKTEEENKVKDEKLQTWVSNFEQGIPNVEEGEEGGEEFFEGFNLGDIHKIKVSERALMKRRNIYEPLLN